MSVRCIVEFMVESKRAPWHISESPTIGRHVSEQPVASDHPPNGRLFTVLHKKKLERFLVFLPLKQSCASDTCFKHHPKQLTLRHVLLKSFPRIFVANQGLCWFLLRKYVATSKLQKNTLPNPNLGPPRQKCPMCLFNQVWTIRNIFHELS